MTELLGIDELPNIRDVMSRKIPVEGLGLPESQKWFVLFSYYTPGEYWSLKGMWTTKEAAIEETKKLPRCWNYHRIMEVDLP